MKQYVGACVCYYLISADESSIRAQGTYLNENSFQTRTTRSKYIWNVRLQKAVILCRDKYIMSRMADRTALYETGIATV